jgi:diguanylate cyclase (GGDEF)-like protein
MMPAYRHPGRSPIFRLITVSTCGLAGFTLGLWSLQSGIAGGINGTSTGAMGTAIAALFALCAAGAALAFFAGVQESAEFVYQETHFDKLTGLLSRTAMIGRIAEAAQGTIRTGEPVYLLDLDIDRFKQINEAIGYAQGDELILWFTRRLGHCLPKGTVIGRLGAGQFGVMCADRHLAGRVEAVAGKLIRDLMKPYKLSSHVQSVNVSIGIVAMPKDGTDPALILRRSNLALQNARANGIAGWSVFHAELGMVADYRRWIESELHLAFERGDFDLHYQPQMDLLKNRTVGYEALIRWHHPERGPIPPAEFIPIAEETGMICQLGEWVLEKACGDARHLPEDCFVAVNISAVQFMAGDFVGLVRGVLRATGLKPERLELELTESAMMQDRGRAASILRELAEIGVSVAVDDFGTGYSNLSYLADFSFRKLKIDRSFVSRIDTDDSSGAVVSTIVGLSRALGVHATAEGVETERQATLLKAAGCDVVQGFLFGEPVPLAVARGLPRETGTTGRRPALAAIEPGGLQRRA